MLNGKRCFPPKIRNQVGTSALITSVQPYTKDSSCATRQEKDNKSIHIGKKNVNCLYVHICLFVGKTLQNLQKKTTGTNRQV